MILMMKKVPIHRLGSGTVKILICEVSRCTNRFSSQRVQHLPGKMLYECSELPRKAHLNLTRCKTDGQG